jgi:hypothetical protein
MSPGENRKRRIIGNVGNISIRATYNQGICRTLFKLAWFSIEVKYGHARI